MALSTGSKYLHQLQVQCRFEVSKSPKDALENRASFCVRKRIRFEAFMLRIGKLCLPL